MPRARTAVLPRIAVLLCLAICTPCFAQSQPTPDTAPLLEKLAVPSSHDAALDQLKALPASAIVPLFEAANDDARPQKIRDDITAALDAIAARGRAAAAKEDAAQSAARQEATGLAWYKKLNPNPEWYSKVAAGFQLTHQGQAAGLDDLKEVLDAGCGDPWVHTIYAFQCYLLGRTDASVAANRFADVLDDLESSGYPVSRKVGVVADFLYLSVKAPAPRITSEAKLNAIPYVMSHFREFVDAHPGHSAIRLIATDLYNADIAANDGHVGPSRAAVDAIAAALPEDSLSCFFKTRFYTDWAWEARGSGYANTVTDEGWKLFDDRLDQARKFGEEGWHLNPLDPDSPNVMIQVCMGQGASKKEMESWFSRAMLADPHDFAACAAKELYLLPKWDGSEKEALDFGRFCVAHGNADDRIPTILIWTYQQLLPLSPNPSDTTSSPEYWRDIQSVYQKLLADKSRLQTHRGQYLTDRAAYVKAACDCGHWKEAAALMKEFGSDIDISAFGGQTLYDADKQKAQDAAAGKTPEP